MKIAFIYDAVYPWIKGGAEKRIYEISKRLVKKGHEVHWFGLKWWNGNNVIMKDGIYIHGIGSWNKLYIINGRRSISEGIYFGIKTLTSLEDKYDIIECQAFPYFSCYSSKMHSLLKNSKLVITWHEYWDNYWFKYLGKKGIFGYIIERLALNLTSNNIAVSEKTKKDLENQGIKNVEIIPNGIDVSRISKINSSKEESDIIFVGRLIKDKNMDVLIKSISLLKENFPDIKCTIIGDGPEKENLISLSKKLNVENNIKFLGFLKDYNNVIAYMKSSKVFVLPSTREGFGIVALEANACGLPVITINHEKNAAADLIRDGYNGYTCNLSEIEIAKKIIQAINEKENIKKNCIKFSREYDWNNITDKLERFYKKLL